MTTRPSIALQPSSRPKPAWAVPAALILLSLIPVVAGASRMSELVGGAAITPQNARFFASPSPVVVHIVSVTIYSLLGAFQFVPALRGRRGWHRIAGGILIPAGLFAALSGLWMSAFYPLPDGDHRRPGAPALRLGNARKHRPRGDRTQAPGLRPPRRLDDARLCDRRRAPEPRPS